MTHITERNEAMSVLNAEHCRESDEDDAREHVTMRRAPRNRLPAAKQGNKDISYQQIRSFEKTCG